MNVTNPKIDGRTTSVEEILSGIKRTEPATFRVVGTIEVPDWRGVANHFQGIAPKNGVIEITGQISASADDWWCASFQESGPAPARVTGVFGTGTYDHAGGIQRLGDLLPMPLEKGDLATVAFYDVSNPDPSLPIYEISMSNSKASAVAITNYRDSVLGDVALLFVYRYEPRRFLVYRCPIDEVAKNGWEYVGETYDIVGDDQFQCFSLVTQENQDGDTVYDTVYLVGFRQNEELWIWSVDLIPIRNYGPLAWVATMPDWKGSQWRYGVGLQISNPNLMRILGCSEDPSGDRDDYEFPIYYWG